MNLKTFIGKEMPLKKYIDYGLEPPIPNVDTIKFIYFNPGMHNSDFMAGQKNVADTIAGQIG